MGLIQLIDIHKRERVDLNATDELRQTLGEYHEKYDKPKTPTGGVEPDSDKIGYSPQNLRQSNTADPRGEKGN